MAEGPAPSFAGVFDLDLTLGDLGPVMDCMSFFYPELYFEDGVLTFPVNMRAGLNDSAAQRKLEETWGRFQAYKARAYKLFAHSVLEREIQLHNVGATGIPTRGCLIRPGLFRILYTLKHTPGCEGLMIVSNNTLRPCVLLANYLLGGLGRYFGAPGAETGPPFDAQLLLHHGHRFREMERTQQEVKTGTKRNNTLKSLWTVKKGFLETGNARFAELLGEPALPYAHIERNRGEEAGAAAGLPKTARIFFADDLTGHQLESELENPEAQFMNCVPYQTQTRIKDLLAAFWGAWLRASHELSPPAAGPAGGAGAEPAANPLTLFLDYFDWLLSRNFWSFGPLLVSGEDAIPRTPEERAELYQRRCSQHTFGVKGEAVQSDPSKYPSLRAYAPWKDDVLDWLDKISMFSEALEDMGAPGGGARLGRHGGGRRGTPKKLKQTRRKKVYIISRYRKMPTTKKMKATARRRRTGLTISRHAL